MDGSAVLVGLIVAFHLRFQIKRDTSRTSAKHFLGPQGLLFLHECIGKIVPFLNEVALQDIPCSMQIGSYFHIHFMLPSNFADIPEIESFFGTERGYETTFPNHFCKVPKSEGHSTSSFEKRAF